MDEPPKIYTSKSANEWPTIIAVIGGGFGLLGLLAIVNRRKRKNSLDGAKVRRVAATKLFVDPRKLADTVREVGEGKKSFSYDLPIEVSKLDSGDYYIIDGHHRLVEMLQAGEKRVPIEISKNLPKIEHTGGAYRHQLARKVRPEVPEETPLFDPTRFFGRLPKRIDKNKQMEYFGWEPPDEKAWNAIYVARHSPNRLRWRANKGRMAWLTWDQIGARQFNEFRPEKLSTIAHEIRDGGALLPAPSAVFSTITAEDVEESQEAASQGRIRELFYRFGTTRPFTERDIGKTMAHIMNGNHRTFAAKLAGEKGVWVHAISGDEGPMKDYLQGTKKG